MRERHAPLVSCESLFADLQSKDWVVFDCRFRLGEPEWGPVAYADGHIPGAHFLDIEDDLSAPFGDGKQGRHPLPNPEEFAALMGKFGVTRDTQIVAYDHEGGWWASRLWWLARHYGYEHVAVLDGGIRTWQRLGLPESKDTPGLPAPSAADIEPGAMPTVDAAGLEKLDAVVDVRAPERYSGEQEPVDLVAGHIPGAINIPFTASTEGNQFLSPDELRAHFEAKGATGAVGCYCGSGVTGTHTVLAMEVAGLPTPALYPGSWSEWSHPSAGNPIKTGSQP